MLYLIKIFELICKEIYFVSGCEYLHDFDYIFDINKIIARLLNLIGVNANRNNSIFNEEKLVTALTCLLKIVPGNSKSFAKPIEERITKIFFKNNKKILKRIFKYIFLHISPNYIYDFLKFIRNLYNN